MLTPAGRAVALAGIAAQRDFVARSLGQMDAQQLAEFDKMLVRVRNPVRDADASEPAADPGH